MFAALAGQGAVLNGEAIHAKADAGLPGAEVLATRPMMQPENWPNGVPDIARVYRPSLAYRLCLVAQGRFDAMITFRDAWEWETAADTLIAQEAGARVTDGQGGAITFNSETRMHPGCMVAAPDLHDALMGYRQGACAGPA